MLGILLIGGFLAMVAAVKAGQGSRLALMFVWFTFGYWLDGVERSTSTFFRRGVLHEEHQHAGKWSARRHVERAAIRWACVALIVAVVSGLIVNETITLAMIADALFFCLVTVVSRVRRNLVGRSHMRKVVRPYATAISIPASHRPEELTGTIVVPRKITQASQIVAPLRADFQHAAGQMAAIENITQERHGHEWVARTVMALPADVVVPRATRKHAQANPGPWLVVSRKAYPPDQLAFSEVADLIKAKGGPEKILAGYTTGREPIWLDFKAAMAHLALSVGTGGGKSSFLRYLVAQFAYWGAADFPVIDTAFVSLLGMEKLPGLRTFCEPQQQWDELERLSLQMDARLRAWEAGEVTTFPLCVLFLEEQNDAALRWRMHWKNHPDRKGRPATPPVYDYTTQLVVGGRKVGYRVIGVWQRMNAASCGGVDAGVFRDQFPTKMLSRFGPQAVTTLTGLPPSKVDTSEINGRYAIVTGHRVRYVQVPYGEAPELMAFAMSGKAGEVDPAIVTPDPPRAIEAGQTARGQGSGVTPLRLVVTRHTLREHAGRTIPLGYEALKSARRRGGFPEGVDGTYTDEEIRDWYALRARSASPALS